VCTHGFPHVIDRRPNTLQRSTSMRRPCSSSRNTARTRRRRTGQRKRAGSSFQWSTLQTTIPTMTINATNPAIIRPCR
jgi:hypothetical protein